MGLRVALALLAISISNAYRDGPGTDGACPGFNETFLEEFGVPGGCLPTTFSPCGTDVCIGVDFPDREPNREQGLAHLATWNPEDKDGTLMCFHAKGYQNIEKVIGELDTTDFYTEGFYRGHGLVEFFGIDVFDESIKNVKQPGLYWEQGGTFELEGEDCTSTVNPPDPPTWTCEFSKYTKVEGLWIDLCQEMGYSTTSHCDGLEKKECTKVNTCSWDRKEKECMYVLQYTKPAAVTEESDAVTEELDAFLDPPAAKASIEEVTVEEASSSVKATVSAWALVPAVMMWLN